MDLRNLISRSELAAKLRVQTQTIAKWERLNPLNPSGCLWVRGLLSSGNNDAMSRELVARRRPDEAALVKRFKRAIAEGDLPADRDPVALTQYVTTVNFGLAVQAVKGSGRAELNRVVDAVLRSWPP